MVSQSPGADGVPNGSLKPASTWGEFNNITFMVQQALAKMQTVTLVRVESCTNTGDTSPVGMVDVTPLVNQIDGAGNPMPHVTIHNVPYLRLQGGANAVIIDPQPGDIGLCAFASRDISKVKATKAQANPGSYRQYSFSDGLYIGGMLNGSPAQYVQFNASGIKIHSPTKVTLDAPVVEIDAGTSCTVNTPTFTVNGATVLNGTMSQTGGGASSFSGTITGNATATFTGDVTANGTSLHGHIHNDPQGGQTSPPI